jgi:hypothetical protein
MGHQTCLTLSPPKLRILEPPAHSRTVTEAPKSPKSAAANAAAGDCVTSSTDNFKELSLDFSDLDISISFF